ncbi:MAG: hypothetical protein CVU01_01925 [Bacteroidetes bacterium HGW-Bacteroidetes-18]|nr:MAG: hypothetical protein CVU01_01925 [Bacteroidetes bacterium HGW-Bacteroidetes-18]
MKFLKFKFLVSVLAVVFAITVSAFTTVDNSQVDENALITGYVYISQQDPCHAVTVDCSPTGEQLCFDGVRPVKSLMGTICPKQLKRNP